MTAVLALLLLAGNPYAEEVRRINQEHADRPGKSTEADLAKRLSAGAKRALEEALERKDPETLLACGEAALDLDRLEDFGRIRAALPPAEAEKLGIAVSRERFLLRGIGGLERRYLEEFARVLDAILDAYDEVFGFEEWSKVPGKKLRVRVRLVERIERPPHFAPEFPFHSEIDFPVADARGFSSPTPDGKFLFYGLCHELGHVIAMWGNLSLEEDRHTWAHYTGVTIVGHLSEKRHPAVEGLRDARWRSLGKEREKCAQSKPSLADADGAMALWIALHDAAGPKAIGAAMNALDRGGKAQRLNRVRYYRMKDFRAALLAALDSPKSRKRVEAAFPS